MSRKNKDTGAYDQEFSGYAMFIGTAHAKAQKLRERDRIRILDTDVTTTFNKAQNKEYINYKVFDFEMADGSSVSIPKQSAAPQPKAIEGDVDEDELPF